ncbi:hypothetical protein EFM06_00115 [Lactobacillus helveticus]|uniref:hypothetical protein n=1 Tax=Lactobacillus helveticus TaxID=1587 RepID=UPI0021823C09|nr:hypothetical protein [Lactobacillus helveticus]MCT0164518.1 hypothetical protein [Lactobacillus helveticus]MCT0192412.1 hypothetical protein [Lactobacillus helveticus]MCT0196324.1 hypothetical protein [Lactobacillus helveticus]
MWIILVINLLVAMAIAYFGLKERQEDFNLFTAGAVFMVFGLILIIGLVLVMNNFEELSVLQFVGGILIAIGIISLIISFVTKAVRTVSLRDVAIAMEVAIVCLLYLTHNAGLSFIKLVVPELAAIVRLVLFIVSRRQMN